ncbi:MAG: hypothetical protein QOH86_1232 [Sphingomonadales bacterium]|nr:hypothetical protein [Sphingomonadales bacterium]
MSLFDFAGLAEKALHLAESFGPLQGIAKDLGARAAPIIETFKASRELLEHVKPTMTGRDAEQIQSHIDALQAAENAALDRTLDSLGDG